MYVTVKLLPAYFR